MKKSPTGMDIIKIALMISNIIFFLYFFNPNRLCIFIVNNDIPKHNTAANMSKVSRIMDAVEIVINAKMFMLFAKEVFFFA